MTAVVGRDRELAKIASFLDLADEVPRVLLLEGEAGIGKSTLWRGGVEIARDRGYRVLSCTAARSETELSFTGLRDLLVDAFDDVAGELSRPQRHALAVALLQEEPEGPPPDAGVLGVAFLGALRALAAKTRTLLALDDVQWLDTPSATVIAFGLRRLRDDSVWVLVAQGGTEGSMLGLKADDLQTVNIRPLSIGALHRVVVEQFGTAYSRPTLRRLHETSGGNPFYALELARALERRGARLLPGEDFPVPSSLEELVRDRLAALSPAARHTIAAAGLLARPTTAELGIGPSVNEAIAASVLERHNGQLAFTHPLLAAAARTSLTPEETRAVHADLAAVVTDERERVRHRALAADAPDEAVAEAAERAAADAGARGEHSTAVSLLQLAVSITPTEALESHGRRNFKLAEELVALGEAADARALLERLAADLKPGGERSEVLVALAMLGGNDMTSALDFAREALGEADSDSRAAGAHAALATVLLQLGEMAAARKHAHKAVELGSSPEFVVQAIAREILVDTLAGAPVAEDVLQRAHRLAEQLTPERAIPLPLALGLRHMYADEHDEARRFFLSALESFQERGVTTGASRLHLTELEVRAGRYEEAERHAAEALREAEHWGLNAALATGLYAKALVDAHHGRQEQARTAAERGLALARSAGDWMFECQHLAVLGLLELSLGRPAEAAAILEPLAHRLVEAGLRDSSVWVGALPNAVEALIAIGELERAGSLLGKLEAQAASAPGPWTRARAARAAGLLAAADDRNDDAVAGFERALAEAEIPFERGRTLLALGALRRRTRQRRLAREMLEQAERIFEELGAELWSKQARAELARIGGRTASITELTPSEQRIAELVAEGKTNKEVAATLVVANRTVESALTQIYRKLDVRSRTELTRKLTAPADPQRKTPDVSAQR
jgi:DNA-binding CsgD family transcriptional regulator